MCQSSPTPQPGNLSAKECVKCILNPPIRAEQAEVVADVLGVHDWHREHTAKASQEQQQAFGQIFVKGKVVARSGWRGYENLPKTRGYPTRRSRW